MSAETNAPAAEEAGGREGSTSAEQDSTPAAARGPGEGVRILACAFIAWDRRQRLARGVALEVFARDRKLDASTLRELRREVARLRIEGAPGRYDRRRT